MISLETNRLKFRQWTKEDFTYFKSYFSNTYQTQYLGGLKNAEDAWRLMATYIGHYHLFGYSYLAIEEKKSHRFVGSVGLWNSDPWPELELGYWILSEMEGKGYATEAANAAKEYARNILKSPSLVSYINKDNTKSIQLSKRLGATCTETIELMNYGLHHIYRYW